MTKQVFESLFIRKGSKVIDRIMPAINNELSFRKMASTNYKGFIKLIKDKKDSIGSLIESKIDD